MNKKNILHIKTTRTERFSVSMALVATVAILAIGSTSTIAMAHRGHHLDNNNSGDEGSNCGFAQTVGNDGLCHYSVQGALNECGQHLAECLSLGKLVLGGL